MVKAFSTEIPSSLNDSYYIVRYLKVSVLPFLYCMALSATIAMLDYTFTIQSITRTRHTQTHITPETDLS